MYGKCLFTLSDKQLYVKLRRLLGAKGYTITAPPPVPTPMYNNGHAVFVRFYHNRLII